MCTVRAGIFHQKYTKMEWGPWRAKGATCKNGVVIILRADSWSKSGLFDQKVLLFDLCLDTFLGEAANLEGS